MFELYDRDKNRNTFLGLGIVGMEELLMNPSQRQIIPLQSIFLSEHQVSSITPRRSQLLTHVLTIVLHPLHKAVQMPFIRHWHRNHIIVNTGMPEGTAKHEHGCHPTQPWQ